LHNQNIDVIKHWVRSNTLNMSTIVTVATRRTVAVVLQFSIHLLHITNGLPVKLWSTLLPHPPLYQKLAASGNMLYQLS